VAQGRLDEARKTAAKVRQLEPTFRLSEFAKTQPYRDTRDLECLLDRLREAGLDD
jgi:adenylate cyclase